MSAAAPTLITLVSGPGPRAREAAIAADLPAGLSCAIVLEGLADAGGALDAAELAARQPPVILQRIAAGCLCCSGRLVLQVTLNRILRRPPQRLYLALAQADHLAALRDWLGAPPYAGLLTLGPELRAGPPAVPPAATHP